MRIAANLFTQRNGQELDDFSTWVKAVKAGQGDDMFRINGAGEMLVYSAADFEDFLEPRPDMPQNMEADLTAVVRLLAENRWPFRLHATYDETIERALNVFEAVNREVPFDGLHWFIDHAETISPRNIERIRALGGGIAVQHRMAFQGEYFIERYGKAQAGTVAADPAHARGRRAGRRRHRCDARGELQPVRIALLAGRRQNGRRHAAVPGGQSARPHGGACACGRSAAPGSRATKAGRARSLRASSPTSPCCRPTISRYRRKPSRASNRC